MKLKELREKKCLTIEELSQAVGIRMQDLQSWENGEGEPDSKELILLANFFMCSPEQLLEKPLPVVHTLRCPHCCGNNLAFITEYHKSVVGRLFATIFLAVTIFLLIDSATFYLAQVIKLKSNAELENVGTIFTCALLYVCTKTMYTATESKTHIQAICKDCGNHWLMN